MSPQNTFTFLLTLAAGAAAGRVQYRQADCSTTTTLDALTVTRVEPMSIYILPEQQQQQPTGTGADDEGFTAVFTTVYPTFAPECSQGLTAATYTITQTCSGSITQCRGYGDDLPPDFTTTQAVCTDGPTPVTAVLTVPRETDAVVTVTVEEVITEPGLTTTRLVTKADAVTTVTVEEVITEPGLTTTRLVTKTCANGPCLPDITAAAIPGADRLTINGGTIVLPVTITKTETDKTTATEKETATVTTTSDSNEFNPNGFNSGAGHMVPSSKSMVFAMSAIALLFLLSA